MQFKLICYAKINLFLHILGKQKNNYHILESLVTFANYGDELSFEKGGEGCRLTITGPYAAELKQYDVADNSILKAAQFVEKYFGNKLHGEFRLVKNLPVASGIGGGSANAAAAVHLLSQAYNQNKNLAEHVVELGADVPVCFNGQNVIMSGIGERLDAWPNLPELNAVLVNPNKAVSTAKIFTKLDASCQIVAYDFVDQLSPKFQHAHELVTFLKTQRNDMQQAAIEICPEIGVVLTELNACEDIMFAQMSGSGATCFAIFETADQAKTASKQLEDLYPNWWIQACTFASV